MKKFIFTLTTTSFLVCQSYGASTLFLGNEHQAQAGTNAGTIRGGTPDNDQAFDDFLGAAGLVRSDVIMAQCGSTSNGTYAAWGRIENNSSTINMGSTQATVSIAGWSISTDSLAAATSSELRWSYNNSNALQAGAPRPSFASGSGSGYGIRTHGNSGADTRNAVRFDFSDPISSFGIFGGDLETGGPGTSPEGFLYIHFNNGDTERINYTPDPSLIPDASFSSSGNNSSETYGNETGRFIGIADDTRLIDFAVFVVGDDDVDGTGNDEQLSFIAPISFIEVENGTCTNLAPTNLSPQAVPEPSSSALLGLSGIALLLRRRK